MAGNGHRLRDAVAESLMVEPALAQAEVELHSSEANGANSKLRSRMQDLLLDAPTRPAFDGFMVPSLEPAFMQALRAGLEEALDSNATLAEAETNAIRDFGLEKLGEFRTAIRGHLSGDAELADRDLAIYVKAGEGRKTAFQRALEENLKDLGERPPFEGAVTGKGNGDTPALPAPAPEDSRDASPVGRDEPGVPVGQHEDVAGQPGPKPDQIKSVTLHSVQPDLLAREQTTAPERAAGAAPARVPRMEPIPLLTAALEAVGVAGDEFGFVLRYGRYAQPGRSSEFLVGGLGLSDLSDRLTGWLEAQGASDCEVQVLDDGSGELMIYLLGHDRPIASPGLEYVTE